MSRSQMEVKGQITVSLFSP